ncbi:chromate transporter [Corallococcus coralloides DSM 2259]|uniref:Chromate transporter n=2 Tax=Corallococcus coralloides TaxID=184914 RepID=H8MZ04_CORCM|nr:chromate transporter [Corallococcus coralloides DSM 2259]
MMEDELVRRRRWLPREEFLDLLGATHLIPGPNSTELAIHLGHRRAGWPGLLVAGVCFIVPAMLLTLAAAWAYVRFGTLPQAGALLYGVKPVILAVVLQALGSLGKTALTTWPRTAVAIGAAVASALGANELLILAVAGGSLAAWSHFRSSPESRSALTLTPFVLDGVTVMAATAPVPASLGGLFLFFLKVGSVLFGSGYVLLAFLRADLVERWGWLTEAQLLDAVAVGQFTPGPVFTTATFIGYLVGGTPGAGLATLGIFLPAFVFVALSGPLIPRLRRSRTAGAVLDGVNAASLALMAVVTWQLGRAALVDGWTVALAVLGAVLLLRWRVNSAWLVLGGAAAGLLRAM